MQIIIGNHFNHNYTISFDLYYYSLGGVSQTLFICFPGSARSQSVLSFSAKADTGFCVWAQTITTVSCLWYTGIREYHLH